MKKRIVRTLVLGLGAMALALVGCGGLDSTADRPDASDAKVAPDAAVCEQLAATARAQFDSYLQSTSALACQVDSDCSHLWSSSVDCFAGCGLSVGTSDVSAVTAAAVGVCDQYYAAGCVPMVLLCPYLPAVCHHGTCASEPAGAADCDQFAAAAQAQFDSYLQSTSSLACQVDSDCSLLWLRSSNCFGGCGLPIGTADVSAVTAAAASACDQYVSAGCPAKTPPPCLPSQAVCDHGTCARDAGAGGPSGSTDAAVDTGSGDVPIDSGAE
jgi:hypothetical protein